MQRQSSHLIEVIPSRKLIREQVETLSQPLTSREPMIACFLTFLLTFHTEMQ